MPRFRQDVIDIVLCVGKCSQNRIERNVCTRIALLATLHLSHGACELLDGDWKEFQFCIFVVAETVIFGHSRIMHPSTPRKIARSNTEAHNH